MMEYERRRKALMDRLPDNSMVVCVAGQMKYMSGRKHSSDVSDEGPSRSYFRLEIL